jgi:outer membrane protein TolC
MKKPISIIFLLTICFSLSTFAQDSVIGDINYGLLEKYIQAAKENYLPKKVLDKQAESAKTAIPVTALSYLDIVGVSYIFRPNNNTAIVVPGVSANPYAVNGLQFSLNLSVGSFFEKPFQIKKARLDYEVAKLNAEEYSNILAVEVKTRYYNYIQQVALLKLSTQTLQDASLITESMKTKFEKTQITLEAYDQSRSSLIAAKNSQVNVEIAYLKAKDALEQIIGRKLSEFN